MKKPFIILSVLLAICLCCSPIAYAETIPLLSSEDTVIELEELENAVLPDSYAIVDHGEPVLTVGYVSAPGATAALSDADANGYYTADFILPDGDTQVYLTGLTRDNVSEIEQAIRDNYADGRFRLTDLGFLDAEKTLEADADDNLCWAASSANILTYTGWAAQAGFHSTDDLFELFINSFENEGGHAYYGVGWFFNGVKNNNPTSAKPLDYPNSGNYLSQYAFDDYAQVVAITDSPAEGMREMLHALRDGCGVSLNVDIYQNGANKGGHAVTCWGFVTDRRCQETDIAHYKSVIITDSDSDERRGVDRRTAPDAMNCYALTPLVQDGEVKTAYFSFFDNNIGMMSDATVLQPYASTLAGETAAEATCNRTASPDLLFNHFYLADRANAEVTQTKFASGSTIYYNPYVLNAGDVAYSGDFTIRIRVTNRSTGTTVLSRNMAAGSQNIVANQYVHFSDQTLTGLSNGRYTITASINDNHNPAEAYFYNNSRSIDFVINDTYRIGDVDGDDEVSSVDATLVMRDAAGITTGLDAPARQRGDVYADGEMNILDATMIQRHLAQIPIIFAIDSVGIYD